jgi:hypothetical protein
MVVVVALGRGQAGGVHHGRRWGRTLRVRGQGGDLLLLISFPLPPALAPAQLVVFLVTAGFCAFGFFHPCAHSCLLLLLETSGRDSGNRGEGVCRHRTMSDSPMSSFGVPIPCQAGSALRLKVQVYIDRLLGILDQAEKIY